MAAGVTDGLVLAAATTVSVTAIVVVPELISLPWLSIGIAVVVAGAAGMARGLNDAVKKEAERRRIDWLKDLSVGAMAGLVVWGIATQYEWGLPLKLSAIAFSGWGGALVLDNVPKIWLKVFK